MKQMGKQIETPSIRLVPHRYTLVLLFLTLGVGVVGSIFTSVYVAYTKRDSLVQRAQDIAYSIPISTVQSLSGTTADSGTPADKQLGTLLSELANSDSTHTTISLLKISDLSVNILEESNVTQEMPWSFRALPSPSSQLLALPQTKTAFFEHSKDASKNAIISGTAPILQPETNDFVAAISVSIPRSAYYQSIIGAASLPLLLACLPTVAIVLDRRSQQKQEEAMRMKSQFVSVASHELRSPLSGILWAVQSLLKPTVKNLTIEQQVILLDMYQSAEESLATINEILDMSAFERNKPQKQSKQRVELGSVIKTAAKTLRLSANERGIKFVFVGNWDDEAHVIGDPNSLRRMFMNLIANAIKYGRDDSEISIRLLKKDEQYMIAIEDQGIGIPQADQKRVLEGYYRAQNAQDTQRAGTGLGLLLAKLVAEQHGGKLWLTSKEGRGTTVFVTIPDESVKPKSS